MSLPLSIAVEYLLSRRRQAVISLLGVALGVSFFIGIAGMMIGTHDYFISRLIDASPHIKILDEFRNPPVQPVQKKFSGGVIALHGLKPKAEPRGIRGHGRILAALEGESGVFVSPTLKGEAFLRYGGKDVGTSITGIEPLLERKASKLGRDMIEGDLMSLQTDSGGIILGAALAKKLGVRLGSKITVVSPAGIIMNMKVTGIFETGVTQVDSVTSYALLKKVQVLQAREKVINQINIRMDDVNAAPELALRLEKRFGYKAESWQETFANIFELFVIQNVIMYSTVLAISLVAGFGIYNIISTSVVEKSRDIAILKSMGFSETDIRMVFLYQGVIVGIIGSVLGWVFGFILVEMIASVRLSLDKDLPIKMTGFPVYRALWLYIVGGCVAVATASFSAFLPARKAAAVKPVDIIRGAA